MRNMVRPLIFFVVLLFTIISGAIVFGAHDDADNRFRGRILLEVEKKGEAWYVDPKTGDRVFMGRPGDAFSLMRSMGVGIATKDLERIPIADSNLDTGTDSDGDTLSDDVERSFGSNPLKSDTDNDGFTDGVEVRSGYSPAGQGKYLLDLEFTKRKAGKIFLQVEQNGEAWYVHPKELQRYYLGRPSHAFDVMRKTGLGISTRDIAVIPQAKQEQQKFETPIISMAPLESTVPLPVSPVPSLLPPPPPPPAPPIPPLIKDMPVVPSQATSTPQTAKPSSSVLGPGEILAPIVQSAESLSMESVTPSVHTKIPETPEGISYTLGYNGPHTMYLTWSTHFPSLSLLSYGKTKSVAQEYKADGYRKEHKTLVKGLDPKTKYYLLYRSQIPSGQYGAQQAVSTATTDESQTDYKETGETETKQETGDLAINIKLPEFDTTSASEEKMKSDLGATPTFKFAKITAYAKQIRVEWQEIPGPTVRSVQGLSYVQYAAPKTDIRVDYGPDERFGFWDATFTKDFPQTERTATSMLLKDFDPGHTYYFQLKLLFGDHLVTRTIAVTTPQEGGTPNVYEIKDITVPRITEFFYPVKASSGLLRVKTDTPSTITVDYGVAQNYAWRYTDRVSSSSPSSVHTFSLKNLEAGKPYHIKLKVQNEAGDYYVYEFARKVL